MQTYEMKWPNRLGVDVYEGTREVGEVGQSRLDGKWGVRTWRNGEAYKWMLIDPTEHLFMTPTDAVLMVQQHGTVIE